MLIVIGRPRILILQSPVNFSRLRVSFQKRNFPPHYYVLNDQFQNKLTSRSISLDNGAINLYNILMFKNGS